MTAITLDATEAKSRVFRMLEKNPIVSFATFGDDYPDVRALLVVGKDDVNSIWFTVEVESNKVAQLRKNPKAAIYGYDAESMTEFRLFGNVEPFSDSASRQRFWNDVKEYFPNGIDSMIVLRFNTERGVYDNYGKETGKFC